jgi:hypothetical protein
LEDGTLNTLWDYFAWAMNALLMGKYPELDWLGRPHCKAGQTIKTRGYKICTNQLRGDWEFYVQVMDFPRWDSEPCMCWICMASNSVDGMIYTNAKPCAGWRPTIRTHESYLNELLVAGRPIPKSYKVLGLRHEGVTIDILHAIDQGVSSHVCANVFVEVVVFRL